MTSELAKQTSVDISTPPVRLAVLGAGSWGTALASLAARNGVETILWGRDAAQAATIDARHENPRYLPGVELPITLRATADMATALREASMVLIVVPSHAFTATLQVLAPLLPRDCGVAWATKGFEPGTGRFLHEVAEDILGTDVPLAIVTGPSFAREVAQGLPTAITVHSDDDDFARAVAQVLHGATFRAYTGNDMLGAELGGAMKNVLAVATGVADGMNLGLNARAGLITRGLNEMLRLNAALGGRADTLMGLSGLGDLVLTCTGDLSRNRRFGLALGRGQSIQQAIAEIGQVIESVDTADEVMRLANRHGIELPISALVQQVLHDQITPRECLQQLLARDQKPEYADQVTVPAAR